MAAKRETSPPPLVGSKWIADHLGVTTRYALQLIEAGEFGTTYDVGRGPHRATVRVTRPAVEAWVAARAREAS